MSKEGQWLQVILDCVDYTAGACGPTERVGAVLPKDIIKKARAALRTKPAQGGGG